MPTTTLKIEGMTCDHCVHSVQTALSSLPGVKKAEVNLAQKQAMVQSDGPLDLSAAIKAVEEEGYQAHVP
jgi:copper chaperone CopZ